MKDSLKEDILSLLTVSSKEKLAILLNEFESKHLNDGLYDVFLEYKDIIITLYNAPQFKNLKGAFLEVLSLNIFMDFYDFENISTDCKVEIGSWISKKTVDIAMKCDDSGLVCECKVPSSKFSWEIFKNLLNIKFYSKNYFSLFAIILATRIRMKNKINKIIRTVDECESLDEIHIIAREDLINLYA